MNNLSSYCGLVDAKTRASDKDLPVLYVVKSKVKISQNFVAFSEYMNFNELHTFNTDTGHGSDRQCIKYGTNSIKSTGISQCTGILTLAANTSSL